MATKSEIREWLEACGAKESLFVAWLSKSNIMQLAQGHMDEIARWLADDSIRPLHLLNPELTGVQGPTFAEWQKQKGREGKVEKVARALEVAPFPFYDGLGLRTIANKILDAIEGEA